MILSGVGGGQIKEQKCWELGKGSNGRGGKVEEKKSFYLLCKNQINLNMTSTF